MKRKIFWAVALLAILQITAVAPLVQAQDMKKLEQLQKEADEIEARVTARGKATPEEVKRIQEIQQEVIQAMGPYGGFTVPAQPNPLQQQFNQLGQQALQQAQEDQRKQEQQRREEYIAEHTGKKKGWPAASVYTKLVNISALKQPAGTTASYTVNEEGLDEITIYLHNANAATLQDIKKQIEAAKGKTMEGGRNEWYLEITLIENYDVLKYYIDLLEYGVLKIDMFFMHIRG